MDGIIIAEIKDTDQLRTEISKLKQTLEENKEIHEKEQNKCKLLEENVKRLEKEKSEKEKKICEKENNIFTLRKQVCKLTEELNVLKSKAIFQVHVLSKYESEMMKNVVEELVKKIRENSRDSDIEVILGTKETDVQQDTPLLVLCIGSNTIGQEIKKMMKGVSVTKKTSVVIIHLKAEHALPVQPSDRVLTNKEFSLLGGIFDIGYMQETGIYKCHLNESNFISIVNFIYRVGEQKSKLK